ncbi:signal peptidase I [Rhizobium sp. KVB221]|uniref:Signal peptidase I n=1 Tax=Rhizobium setariae TaxID=2801340 RepID=A0A936YRS3_9HYPH|nr:signal peptidase I [Rhizobium setariae]MBL0371160.1 signal peptidase I [Rhizobium setariae]
MSVSEQKQPEEKNAFWETIVVLFQAFLLAAVIRTVLLQPFTIPSGSMVPTLLIGDYLLVNKFSYGYSRYSLPVYNPEWFKGRIMGSEPGRGDVVVFRLPKDPSIDYIKRVIGLPGDKIQMIDGVLHINNKPVPRVADGEFNSNDSDTAGVGVQVSIDKYEHVPMYRETLDSGVSYETLDLYPNSEGDNTQVFTVPEKHYFMMGDNRDNSSDSRFSVGYVPEENLVGRASFIIFSLGNDTPFLHIWKWPANLRYERFFKGIK